jgi:hypothetical protein
MITNGGPHKSAYWAEKTSELILEIGEHVAGEKRSSAIKLQAAIIDILEGHHRTVKHGERDKVAEHGHDRLNHSLDCSDHLDLDEAVSDIVTAAANTAWAEDFANDETKAHLRELLSSHFHTSMHIERSWHADRNPNAAQSQEFKAKFHPGDEGSI